MQAPHCMCIGHYVTYKCVIIDETGEGSTVWSINTANGDQCQITLSHNQLEEVHITPPCNSLTELEIDQNNRRENDCYTSQLGIHMISTLNGSTISCLHINGQHVTVIDNFKINLSGM